MNRKSDKTPGFTPKQAPYSSLLTDISHDLKGFLNPIVGFSSVLLQDNQRLKADQLKHVKIIYESAKKLLDRIDALVLLLRLQQPNFPQIRESLELGHLMREQIELLREAAAAKNVKLELAVVQPVRLHADAGLLGQGTREILEYCLERLSCGEIRINCRLEQTPPASQAVVEIACPAMRVSAREAESWRMFLESEGETAAETKGTGMWLALAQAAIKHAGGRLLFSPAKGWEIRLPG